MLPATALTPAITAEFWQPLQKQAKAELLKY